MAATIDHLRSDHAVRVLRDFTDARGTPHRAGETGIIRGMGLDTAHMEIWIEWEHNGALDRMRFALSSTIGPGNGRMREYFELGDVDPGEVPVPPPAPQRAVEPAPRPQPFAGRHPTAGTNLGPSAVACDCDAALHRPVLVEGAGVNACLRCGTVTCTHSIGDDGRHTGDSWHAYIADAVSGPLLDWLSRWPRVTVRHRLVNRWPTPAGLSQHDIIYLPADARCATAAEVTELENAWRGHEPDFPTQRPPDNLPTTMQAFAQFATALRLTPASELSQLMASAEPRNPASALAVSRLLQRTDAFEVMVAALRSADVVWQSAGAAMAQAARPMDPRLPDVLVEIMNGLSLELMPHVPGRIASGMRVEELLVVIADHQITTDAMLSALPKLQRRVAPLDAGLASNIGVVLRELHGIPPARVGFPF
ncbi:MAG: hypothetical protein IPP90_15095 [Gemmatimonadaceae bacterium]|nr:hypothetical protein [Gemmatimonadaceae bacterium]